MENEIKILIATQKEIDFLDQLDEIYSPIIVGNATIQSKSKRYLFDNTGNNISSKNPNYCELTALYWAWKNLTDTDFFGLTHYRRFFNFSNKQKITFCKEVTEAKFCDNIEDYIFKKEIIEGFDIILAAPLVLKSSLSNDYIFSHVREDFDILRNTLYDLFPEFKESFIKVMDENNKLSPFNMFITKRELFLNYSEWLFTILDEVEKKVSISTYPYQGRIFGFMAERLLNVYVHQKKMNIKYFPVNFIGSNNISIPIYKEALINSAKNRVFNILKNTSSNS